MPLEPLLKAARIYLDRERRFANSEAVVERAELQERLQDASRNLQAEMHCAAEAAGQRGAVRNIMVAVDDSEPSEWAVERAVALAEDLDARLTLVHVLDVTPIAFAELAPYEAEAREAQENVAWDLLHRMAALVPRGLLAEELIREGNVAEQIVLAAEQFKPDLLVVGTHGRGLLGRILLGSIAESVLRRAPGPLLVVAHPDPLARGRSRAELCEGVVVAPKG